MTTVVSDAGPIITFARANQLGLLRDVIPTVKPVLDALIAGTFRLSKPLYHDFLHRVGERP